MGIPQVVSILGLGFGDEGKGHFTHLLARRLGAHTVARFNGGAQAGHNVVLEDGRHHTFAQFGSATFTPGVVTVLAHPVVVHPTALLIEADHLARVGVQDALARLQVDPRCRVNTPFHQSAGRLRELSRGASGHGTCGVGVGETVRFNLAWSEDTLRFEDLRRPARAKEKLELLRRRLWEEWRGWNPPPGAEAELETLQDSGISTRWLAWVQDLLRQIPDAGPDPLAERLRLPGSLLFEGAQGLLLDEWRGFHPHTTWSSPSPQAVAALVAESGLAVPVRHLGVLRAYLTRHGTGPMPTEDPELDALPEPHNADAGWQGRFRRGHPDGVLATYAAAVAGSLDGLLLSHLDVFDRCLSLRWCEAYESVEGRMERLPLSPGPDLLHQERLTRLLQDAQPCWAPERLTTLEALISRLEAAFDCPVRMGSWGPCQARELARRSW